ncbi:MAG: LolA family protein [Terracidiphilus sp.]
MHCAKKFVFCTAILLLLLPGLKAFAAAAVSPGQKDRDSVLRQLDEAAGNFRSTSADFEFDSITTDPIYDKEVQKGTVYYERSGSRFKMAAHIREVDGRPVPKMYVYSGGVFRLYEKLIDQVTTLTQVSKYQSYLMLGFGASGRELEQKWEITYLGSETLEGVKTAKLELVPKDPAVRKNLPRVTIWVDPQRGVSLKQVFDEGPGQYRVCVYFNIKVNQPLPSGAFTFKTDSKTQYVVH